MLSTSPTRIGSRVDQVEAVAVVALQVRDVVHRVDDEIDRHHIDAPASMPIAASIAAKATQLLDQLEE